ncbi:MAG: glutaredoxin family protein [Lautropia sp.]
MKRVLANGLVLVVLGSLSLPAVAQYKWLTADGRTVYSDVPPPGGATRLDARTERQTMSGGTSDRASAQVDPPFELKATSSRYPVVLYTATDCVPCNAARQHLGARGVPFSEKSIATVADFEAFKARGFSDNSFPAMTVGREKAVGFEPGAFDRLLDAAGYPRTSMLPAGYRQAAAEPMTTRQPERAAAGVPAPAQVEDTRQTAGAGQSATERYRQQIQAGSTPRPPDAGPAMRF